MLAHDKRLCMTKGFAEGKVLARDTIIACCNL